MIAATKTAAAETSLMIFIAGNFSVEIKSASFSIAVFNNSANHTKPITITNAITSSSEIGIIKVNTITMTVANK